MVGTHTRVEDLMMNTRRAVALATVTLVMLTLTMTPAVAIEKGQPDREGHRNVGLLGFDVDGPGPIPAFGLCSGFVISDSAFVTAAHCITFIGEGVDWVVTLEGGSPSDPVLPPGDLDPLAPDPTDFPILVPVEHANAVHLHPDHNPATNAHDIAVLTFDQGTFDVKPVRLAPSGMLDRLDDFGILERLPARLVGYGTDGVASEDPLLLNIPGYRQRAWTGISDLTANRLVYGPTDRWPGHTGMGDSGGPQLVLGRVVSLTSLGDTGQRLDTPSDRSFLLSFLSAGTTPTTSAHGKEELSYERI